LTIKTEKTFLDRTNPASSIAKSSTIKMIRVIDKRAKSVSIT